MDAHTLIEVGSQIIMGLLAWNSTRVIHIIDDLRKSVEKLNISMAVIIDKTMSHEKEINHHGERIRSLEIKHSEED